MCNINRRVYMLFFLSKTKKNTYPFNYREIHSKWKQMHIFIKHIYTLNNLGILKQRMSVFYSYSSGGLYCFGAEISASERLGADVLAPIRFGAQTFQRWRFGADTCWRQHVLAPKPSRVKYLLSRLRSIELLLIELAHAFPYS